MAENPMTWGKLEHAIDGALTVAWAQKMAGMVGLSDVRIIADALRDAGLVKEDEEDDSLRD